MYIPKSEYYELPNKYNKTIVRLLVQSPTRMFVYWDVSDDYINSLKDKKIEYSSAKPVLKIKNLTMNYSYDIPIDPFTNNYYIDVKDPDCEYQVELERKYSDKTVNVCSSNLAMVPRSNPVYVGDSEEVVFRNYVKLDMSDKFTVYYRRPEQYVASGNTPQDYTRLSLSSPFNDSENDNNVVDGTVIINEGSFTRYENGLSSFENMSSFTRYENVTSSSVYSNR